MPQTSIFPLFLMTCLALPLARASADDDAGWVDLLGSQDLSGWMSKSGGEPGAAWKVEDGVLVLTEKGGGDIWTKETYGDFELQVEFLTEGNSGIFIRTAEPKNNVQTGIEIQVNKPGKPGKHSVGAVYDLKAPSKDAAKKDDWNKVLITARDNLLTVTMNGERIIEMDLDDWTEPNRNPDGTKNKYKTALKDFARTGHIGFQDHGAQVKYRNIRIKPL